jgi:hypothetical protein
VIDAGVVTITLPQVSSGVYVEPGYEYRVDIGLPSTTGESLFEFMFLGELENMLTSVQSVLLQAPGSSSMDIARMIYLNSADAIEYDSGQGTTPTKAGTDYVLYSTLWQIATTTPPSAKITLGDLTVDPGSTSSESRWRKLMEDALAKLSKADPKFLVKGSGNTSPHAARDWDATGTTKRRIGKTS